MTHPDTSADARATSATLLAAMVFGAVFIVVGILGFVPGITTGW